MLKPTTLGRCTAVALMLAGIVLLAGGCATPHDSDIPWNSPASWEGSPFIPGFSE